MWLDRALTPNKTVFMNWQMLGAASVSHTQNVLTLKHITPKKVKWRLILGIDNKEQNWFWRNELIIGCTLTDKYYINNAWVIGIFWLEHFVPGLAFRHCIVTLESKTNKQKKQKRSSPRCVSLLIRMISLVSSKPHTLRLSHTELPTLIKYHLSYENQGGRNDTTGLHLCPHIFLTSLLSPPLAPEIAQNSSGVARFDVGQLVQTIQLHFFQES